MERAQFMWLAGLAGAAILASACSNRVNRFSTLAPPVRPAGAGRAYRCQVEQVLINIRSTMFSTAPLSSAPLLQSPPRPALSRIFGKCYPASEAPVDVPQIDRAGFVP